MKFLVDENLSPLVAELLNRSGHDAVHVRELDAVGAPDDRLVSMAADSRQIIISADTDFGTLLAQARATAPSVILVREIVSRRPAELAGIILAQLDVLEQHLASGAIVAITPTGSRVRSLPLR